MWRILRLRLRHPSGILKSSTTYPDPPDPSERNPETVQPVDGLPRPNGTDQSYHRSRRCLDYHQLRLARSAKSLALCQSCDAECLNLISTFKNQMQIEIAERLICQFLDSIPTRLSQDDKSLLFDLFVVGISVIFLVDSGCTALAFIDLTFVQKHNLSIRALLQPRPLQFADGGLSTITNYAICQLIIGPHIETLPFYLTKLQSGNLIILGYPWFQLHNPDVDWSINSLIFKSQHCSVCCLISLETGYPDLDRYPVSSTINGAFPFQQSPACTPVLATFIGKRRLKGHRHRPKTLIIMDRTYDGSELTDPEQIRLFDAPNFLLSIKEKGIQVYRLDFKIIMEVGISDPEIPDIPDLIEDEFQVLLAGDKDATYWTNKLNPTYYGFIDSIFNTDTETFCCVTDDDIAKFLKGKKELILDELKVKLSKEHHVFLDFFQRKNADILPLYRPYDHKIEIMPGKEPLSQKNRPFFQPELMVIKKWLDIEVNKGLICGSTVPYASSLLLVRKPGGGVRICADYRGLNNVIIKNRYPLPLIWETLDALCKAKIFTKLDIIIAFNRVRIAEGHEWKTAFIIRFGFYEILMMSFGFCNVPSIFQNFVNDILHKFLNDFATVYLDDILIYSKNKKEYIEYVNKVLAALEKAGLLVDILKCEFHVKETRYLGLIISITGFKMDPEKVKVILGWAPPCCLKDLQRFIGFVNFYRRFIKHFSKIAGPLTGLMKKDMYWTWTPAADTVFAKFKHAFTSAPVLVYFDPSRKTILETDVSD